MPPLAEMIVRNVCGLRDPDDIQRMVYYVSCVLSYCPTKFNRAKKWHDHIFRPRYYYTSCAHTLHLLSKIHTKEMARHVIFIDSSVFMIMTTYLLQIEEMVRMILDAGLYVVGYRQEESFLLTTPHDVFRASSIEFILEGSPFEQEYVTDIVAFQKWLSQRLPRADYVK